MLGCDTDVTVWHQQDEAFDTVMLPGSIEMRVRRVLDTKILPVHDTMRMMNVLDTPSRGCLYTQLMLLDFFSLHHSRASKIKV